MAWILAERHCDKSKASSLQYDGLSSGRDTNIPRFQSRKSMHRAATLGEEISSGLPTGCSLAVGPKNKSPTCVAPAAGDRRARNALGPLTARFWPGAGSAAPSKLGERRKKKRSPPRLSARSHVTTQVIHRCAADRRGRRCQIFFAL
ncbi:unnamed protein product [Ixodes pacificus]